MEEYKVDNSNDDITIEVNVSIPGIVSTTIAKRRPPGAFEVFTESFTPTGRIIEKRIGQAKSVLNLEIEIDTTIKLDLIPDTDRLTVFNNLSIDYILRGGVNGETTFKVKNEEKEKTPSGRTMRVIKKIKFIN